MRAMVLTGAGRPLELRDMAVPEPKPGQVRIRISACGVCRTDLHVVDGELTEPKLPLVPGHEIVGRIDALGAGVEGFAPGMRVGVRRCVRWGLRRCGRHVRCGVSRGGLCVRDGHGRGHV